MNEDVASPLSWGDQPKEVAGAQIIASMSLKTRRDLTLQVEVRLGEWWYLTVGNLFGSSTMKCEAPEHVLMMLGKISEWDGSEPIKVPKHLSSKVSIL